MKSVNTERRPNISNVTKCDGISMESLYKSFVHSLRAVVGGGGRGPILCFEVSESALSWRQIVLLISYPSALQLLCFIYRYIQIHTDLRIRILIYTEIQKYKDLLTRYIWICTDFCRYIRIYTDRQIYMDKYRYIPKYQIYTDILGNVRLCR